MTHGRGCRHPGPLRGTRGPSPKEEREPRRAHSRGGPTIPAFDEPVTIRIGKKVERLGGAFTRANEGLDQVINEHEKGADHIRVRAEVKLTGVNRVVAEEANDIERLVDRWGDSPGNQSGDAGIESVAGQPQVDAELLDDQAQEGGRATRRVVEDGSRLVKVGPNMLGKRRMSRRTIHELRLSAQQPTPRPE